MKKLLLAILLLAGLIPASAYTDLDTGMRVFLTRDPAGFVDGPNLYTYVQQNPWTHFDPEGLSEDVGDGIVIHRDSDGHMRVIQREPSRYTGTQILQDVAEVQINNGDAKSMNNLNAHTNNLTTDKWQQSVVLSAAIQANNMSPEQRDMWDGAFAMGMAEMGGKQGGGVRISTPETASAVNTQNKQATAETTTPAPSAKTTQADSQSTVATVTIDASKYPESAQHIQDAQAAGQPSVLTIDRGGAAANRKAAMQGQPTVAGKDRDEYPPAMFSEGGQGASVKPIPPSDNRGAGSTMMHQTKGLPNGTQVQVKVKNDSQ